MSHDARRDLGRAGEDLAAAHLERLGLRVVARNYRTRLGELDLVAVDPRTIVFCEVKTRRASGAAPGAGGSPFDAIGPLKQSRIRAMAGRWLAEERERPRAAELRFDAIGVVIDPAGRLVRLDHLEGAF